jgi:hypothetical protein
MAVGVAFGIVGLFSLFAGHLTSLLTLAVAALIIYTSIFQLGGWYVVKQDIKLFALVHLTARKKSVEKKRTEKKRNNFKVIK